MPNDHEIQPWELTARECVQWSGKSRNWFNNQGFEKLRDDPRNARNSLYDVRAVCAAAFTVAGDFDVDSWKERKVKAEALGLEMRNAKEAGLLVPVEAVKPAYTRGFTAMADVLGSTTSRIRRRKPDIDSATLAIVEESINEARNEAASLDFSAIVKPDGDPVERSASHD